MNAQAKTEIVTVAPSTPLTPMAMIERALEIGANADTLEKLMNLQERWQASQAKQAFDVALAAAKAEFPAILKTGRADVKRKDGSDGYAYSYERLEVIAATILPIMKRHSLNYRFTSGSGPTGISVTCIITHEAGHREETTLTAQLDTTGGKNNVQAVGSTTTYLQRYTLKLALGLVVASDSDGVPPTDNETITADQFREIQDLLEKTGSDEDAMLAYVRATELESMSQAQAKKAIAAMQLKLKKGVK
jgi:hypothetical protein